MTALAAFLVVAPSFLSPPSFFQERLCTGGSRRSHESSYFQQSAALPKGRRCSITLSQEPSPALLAELQARQQQAQQRGAAVLGAVLFICAWFFTVPPEIRRSHICLTEDTTGCVTFGSFTQSIAEHYATCSSDGVPCVQFDLSVDPKSVEIFSEIVNSATQ